MTAICWLNLPKRSHSHISVTSDYCTWVSPSDGWDCNVVTGQKLLWNEIKVKQMWIMWSNESLSCYSCTIMYNKDYLCGYAYNNRTINLTQRKIQCKIKQREKFESMSVSICPHFNQSVVSTPAAVVTYWAKPVAPDSRRALLARFDRVTVPSSLEARLAIWSLVWRTIWMCDGDDMYGLIRPWAR